MQKKSKRAQELSTTALILIVIGVIILVFVVLGFSIGWNNLFEKIGIFAGGGSSIESITLACKNAVGLNSIYSFCQDFKQIKVNGKTQYLNCQDDRITLDETIDTCVGDPAKNKCIELIKDGTAKADTLVNNKLCSSQVNCNEIIINEKTATEINKGTECNKNSEKELIGAKITIDGGKCCIATS